MRRCFSLLVSRGRLMRRRRSLCMNRRRLVRGRLRLRMGRRSSLGVRRSCGLRRRVLHRRLGRTSLGLSRPLGKSWSWTVVHCRCDRMHLFRIDRSNLNASGRRLAASGLGAQRLQLRWRYRGATMQGEAE